MPKKFADHKNKLIFIITFYIILFEFSFTLFAEQENVSLNEDKDISIHDARHEATIKAKDNPFGIGLYKPNYLFPVYYTNRPYKKVYENKTPDNQKVRPEEFKFQLSIILPLIRNIFNSGTELNFTYSQVSYWQLYQKSSFFRETNYEPDLFLYHKISQGIGCAIGIVHESNGRGSDMERSWNRAYMLWVFSGRNWMIKVNAWYPVIRSEETLNKDILDYMGYGQILLAYKISSNVITLQMYNYIESSFQRGSANLTWSYPLIKNLNLYLNYFYGYGQSLIEYNHRVNSFGIGITANDWI
jgi:phospholipase A1/A2